MVKRILLGLLGVVVVVIAGIALAFFNWNGASGFIARQASKALNREVAVDGGMKVTLGDPIQIHVEGIRVANVEWSDEKNIMELKALDARLRLWPLLRGAWELPELRLTAPKLVLEKNKDGVPNWNFGPPTPSKEAARQTVRPDDRSDVPIIGSMVINAGRLRYRDPRSDIDIDSDINTATGRSGEDQLHLDGKGNFAGKPFTLAIEGGSLQYLRDNPKPYPIKAEATIGQTGSRIEGSVAEPVKLDGVDLSVELHGDDLAEVFPILGIPTPRTRPYSLAGHLSREGQVWRFGGMTGKVGESDLSGTVVVDLGGERPKVTADLTSRRLAALDLAGFIGASPRGSGDYPTEGWGHVIPATPVNVGKLRNTDMEVRFTGQKVEASPVPFENMDAHLKLENGRARVDPMALGLGGGRVIGTIALDGSQQVPEFHAELEVRRVQLAQFFHDLTLAREMGGTIGGRIQLTGRGATVAEIIGSADGKLGVAVDGGRISSLVVKALKTNILEALGVVLSGDKSLPFNCLVVDVAAEKGLVRPRALVLDTPETVVTGDGTINLRTEALDLTVLGRAKKPQVLATHVPVHVRGTFANPDISVDPTETVARGAAAVALGVLLTPLASILPLLDPGSGEQPECGKLVQNAKSPTE